MNGYKNMKLKGKFWLMTGTITILVVVLSFLSILSLEDTISNYDNQILENQDVIDNATSSINTAMTLRTVTLRLESRNSELSRGNFDAARNELKEAYDLVTNALQTFRQNLSDINSNANKDRTEEINLVDDLTVKIDEFYEEFLNHINLHEQGYFDGIDGESRHTEHSNLLRGKSDEIFVGTDNDSNGHIFNLTTNAFDNMINSLSGASLHANKASIFLVLIGAIVIIFTIIQGLIISKSVRKPISNIVEAASNVADGNIDVDIRTNTTDEMGILSNAISDMTYTFQGILEDIHNLSENIDKGDINYRINTDKYKGAFKQVTEAINSTVNELIQDTLHIIGMINSISSGNFNTEIKQYPGDKIVATKALEDVQETLKAVSYEINGLIDAANEGNLEYRIDSKEYQGQWKITIEGLNTFIENVVIPIKETQNALNQFSTGNFGHRITNEYKGEFNNIKQTVNYTAETIGSYISEISSILEEMSNKNFDVSIDREYLGDFKAIQKSVNLIIKNLNILTKDIISSAEQVSAGAKQISESSISLAEGATEQAESVERLNNVVKLISEKTAENAKGSNQANDLAIKTKENASKGSEQMNNMLVAMEDINVASNSISNIIKVIDDIAFQTNILALNAAVEAARAGEHGKGFAVVAEEVRNLAARSQQAARETTELIESSVQKVEEGSKIANHTAEALLNIVNQIEDISKLVEACAKSSNEQETSITQITESISQIANVTQNNTATSEESAAAAEELASQAEVFYASVADFKLRQDNSVDSEY